VIQNCIISGNSSETGGGGICCHYHSSPVIANCTFDSNDTTGIGGGILCVDSSPVIRDCLFTENNAQVNGGAVSLLSDSRPSFDTCIFNDNTADYRGGAIAIDGSRPIIGGTPDSASTFSNNYAASGADIFSESFSGTVINAQHNRFTGYCLSDYYITPSDDFDLQNCISELSPIIQNVYIDPAGDDNNDGLTPSTAFKTLKHALSVVYGTETQPLTINMEAGEYSDSATGEHFPLPMISYVTIKGSQTDNTILRTTDKYGFFLACLDSESSIISIMMEGGKNSAILCDHASPSISDCSISNVQTDDAGAGICCINRSAPVISNCSITNNQVSKGSGGGAIASVASSPRILNCLISGNIARKAPSEENPGHGGGLYMSESSNVYMENCEFSMNQAIVSGGAVYCNHSRLESKNCTYNENTADQNGGAIACNHNTSKLFGNHFNNNRAGNIGGALYLESTDCVIGGSADHGNEFVNNNSPAGSDVASRNPSTIPVNCSHNTFSGIAESDYYVAPMGSYDLSYCSSQTAPITQTVFVSPSGDDSNDGISETTPLRTIKAALSRILVPTGNRLTVQLDSGTYSSSSNGEIFPLPLLNNVSIVGADPNTTIINAKSENTVLFCFMGESTLVENVTIQKGSKSGIYCLGGSPVFSNTTITQNHNSDYGGGVFCEHNATPVFENCRFFENSAFAGGAVSSNISNTTFFNCAFTANESNRGAAIYSTESDLSFSNCTITGNTADSFGGAFYCSGCTLSVRNSIIWDDSPREFYFLGGSDVSITYSDVQTSGDEYEGIGNINENPLFVMGPSGMFYLSNEETGHTESSPCLDAGDHPSSEECSSGLTQSFCLDSLSTRSDTIADSGIVDIGFHYSGMLPECSTLGVTIDMPDHQFSPGDSFYLNIEICSLDSAGSDIPLFVILDVYGDYFFAPSFGSYDNYIVSLHTGINYLTVLSEFVWPQNAGSASGIQFISAMTTKDFTNLYGEMDSWEFGWSE